MIRTKSGRWLALITILLLAANLRTAVASLSPLLELVGQELPISVLQVAILGMLAPLGFAASGRIGPLLARGIGILRASALLLVLIAIGHLIRALAFDFNFLVLGTALSLLGMGIGNVIMPVLVKRFFPDRIALVTTAYITVVSISATLPPFIAVPVAEASGWRLSLGLWLGLALVAIIPLLPLLKRERANGVELSEPTVGRVRIWRSPTALALAVNFAISSIAGYVCFAWLPIILRQHALVGYAEAGALLGLFSLMGLPAALAMPRLAERFKRHDLLVYLSLVFFLTGYLGLALAPTVATALWVALIGLGPLLFPLGLTLFALRTRSQQALLALSGFAQGTGYLAAAIATILMGVGFELSGDWRVPLIALAIGALPTLWTARVLGRGRLVDDELAEAGSSAS